MNYTTGIYPFYKRIVDNVLPKYENDALFKNDQKITNLIASIKSFVFALEADADNISGDVDKTLNIIYDNLIQYINTIVAKTGGEEIKSTKELTILEFNKSPVELHKSAPSTVLTPIELIENNTYNILPAQATQPLANLDNPLSAIYATIKEKMPEDYADKIRAHFDTYKQNRISSVEAIKKNNRIITITESNDVNKANLIRPQLLLVLVKKIAGDLSESNIYSTINFYLVHNETYGITLKEYDAMMLK